MTSLANRGKYDQLVRQDFVIKEQGTEGLGTLALAILVGILILGAALGIACHKMK